MTLLETMRADGGEVVLLERHLARLAASSAAFGIRYDEQAARDAIVEALTRATPAPSHRVRLTLGAALNVTAAPLVGAPLQTVWLCPEPLLEAGGPLCRHKTTDRAHYERPFAQAQARGAGDALLVNARGEVVEGSRTSVWVQRGGALLTPPLSVGGLPGVMRAHLLETRPDTAEAHLTSADLRSAEALYVSNALRGLVEVSLVEEAAAEEFDARRW